MQGDIYREVATNLSIKNVLVFRNYLRRVEGAGKSMTVRNPMYDLVESMY